MKNCIEFSNYVTTFFLWVLQNQKKKNELINSLTFVASVKLKAEVHGIDFETVKNLFLA